MISILLFNVFKNSEHSQAQASQTLDNTFINLFKNSEHSGGKVSTCLKTGLLKSQYHIHTIFVNTQFFYTQSKPCPVDYPLINCRLYPCSTKRREGLENPSPTPKISRGRSPREISRVEGNLERFPATMGFAQELLSLKV